MLIDGEKWACEACVRGHRVSSCHHSDRPLTHINKKGRPVSQCAHCRGLRKSRTTHVKCECGDKKSSNNNCDPHAIDKGDIKLDSRPRCGCNHGQRCMCALKKEHHLDPVPETGLPPQAAISEPKKPRLTSTKSESMLTVFRDGYHKPAHKHNDMAHKCGMPYTIPRSHTIHAMSEIALRSADHLPLTKQPVDLHLNFDQAVTAPQRLVKSEHGSPERAPLPVLEQINTQIPPLDISFSAFGPATESPLNSIFQDPYQEPWFASPDTDVSLSSATLSVPPVEWSGLPLCSSSTTSSQPPSYTNLDYNNTSGNSLPNNSNLSYSGLSASSSGEISEVEDFGALPASTNDLHDFHSVSDGSEIDQFRFSSAPSLIGLSQTQMLSPNNIETINIDDFLQSASESTAVLEQLHATVGMDPKSIPPPRDYEIRQAPVYIPGDPVSAPMTSLRMNASRNEIIWPQTLFDSSPLSASAVDEAFPQQQWVS